MSDTKRILAVDDESDILLLIRTALQSEGFEVKTAGSGEEGLAAAREFRPDLVILDMMMPQMNGFEVLRQLRDIPELKGIPAIMLTGVSDRNNIREALDSGIEYYMVKPFEFHDLVSKVKIAISDSEKRA